MSLPARATPQTRPARGRTPGLAGGARRWRTRPTSRAVLTRRVAELSRDAGLTVLEDRLMPQGRGRIDALLTGPAGITVVDALLLDHAPRIARMAGGFAEPAGDRLIAGGRDHTGAVRAVERQVLAISRVLSLHGRAHDLPPVRGALCVPDGLALITFTQLRLHDVLIDGPQTVAFVAARPGPLGPEQVRRLAARLESAFPSA